jgi:hypothetical protein
VAPRWTCLAVALLALGATRAAWAQAEPAPAGYVPPPAPNGGASPAPDERAHVALARPWHIAVFPRLDFRLGSGPPTLPLVGYGAGVEVSRALLEYRALRLGLAIDFAYDRFAHERGNEVLAPYGSHTQYAGHAEFALLALLDLPIGRVRPWLAGGGGLSVSSYEDPAVTGGPPAGDSKVEAVPLVKAALGVAVTVYHSVDVGLRGDFTLLFSSTAVGMPARQVFAPGLATLALDLGFRF